MIDVLPRLHPGGVNVATYGIGVGMGDAGRFLISSLQRAGHAVSHINIDYPNTIPHCPETLKGFRFDQTILCLNPSAIAGAGDSALLRTARQGRVIGVWFWEAGKLTSGDSDAWNLVDEVWVASRHCEQLLQPAPRPVLRYPFAVPIPVPTSLERQDLDLPDGPLIGLCTDLRSGRKRKNPEGLVRAFMRAFPRPGQASLILKLNGHDSPQDLSSLLRGRGDVHIQTRQYSEIEMQAWYQLIDCYASLHRSEGLGLGLAHAMAAGTACIATGWSGNLEFMSTENSRLVPFELVEVGHGTPYDPLSMWAEPSEDAAVSALRQVVVDPDAWRRLGESAASTMRDHHTFTLAAPWFREHVGPFDKSNRRFGSHE